jgi:hypothetical protein
MLVGYFDDSGTHDDSEIIVWAGFVGSEDQWAGLTTAWTAKLAAPLPGKPPLRRFHMSKCEARDGEFIDYSVAEKDALIHDFRHLIIDSNVIGRAFAVERQEWDRRVVGAYQILFGDAEGYCFAECISFALAQARENEADKKIKLIFDDRSERAAVHRMLGDRYKNFYDGNPAHPDYPHLGDVSFKSSYKEEPLQAADMLAWETYRVALDAFKMGRIEWRPHIRQLIETGRVTAGLADKRTIAGFVGMFEVRP